MTIHKHGDRDKVYEAQKHRLFLCDTCGCVWDAEKSKYATQHLCKNSEPNAICPDCGTLCWKSTPLSEPIKEKGRESGSWEF